MTRRVIPHTEQVKIITHRNGDTTTHVETNEMGQIFDSGQEETTAFIISGTTYGKGK